MSKYELLRAVFEIFIREFSILSKRTSAWVLAVFVPVVIFTYLGAIYFNGAIDQVEIAILDQDNSALSRRVISQIEGAPKLRIIKMLNSEDNIEQFFLANPAIKGLFVIPKNFSRQIFLGNQEVITVFTNSSNIVYGNLIYKEAALLINTISGGINLERLKIKQVPPEKALKMVMPIKVISKPLFNPYYNYLQYLLPGLTTVLLQMIVFFLAARSINNEVKRQTLPQLFHLAEGNILTIISGKLLAYTIIGFVIGTFTLLFFQPLMGVSFGIEVITFLPVIFLFVLTNSMLGLMFSALFNDEAIAMDMAFGYNSPAFVFSGFTFPIMAMPSYDAWYAQLIPYTHFLKIYTQWVEMNLPVRYVIDSVITLIFFFLVGYLFTSLLLLQKQKTLSIA